jgi:glutamine synthetase
MALHYIGGIIKHAKSIAALTNPTTNSYRRLVPGFEAPVNLAYSSRNRSASVRIPITGPNPKTRRIEVRFPDPSCNPYLAFSAMLMAGLDGIQNKINPGDPLDKDIYALSPEELKDVPHMPGSLEEALDDHTFSSGTTSSSCAATSSRRTRSTSGSTTSANRAELNPIRMRPTPHEFVPLLRHLSERASNRRGRRAAPRGHPPCGVRWRCARARRPQAGSCCTPRT